MPRLETCTGSGLEGKCALTSDCADGFTVQGACPHDPNNVRCCLEASCSYSSTSPVFLPTTGSCFDTTVNNCKDGFFVQERCPGPTNIQCCLRIPPAVYVHEVYDAAVDYRNGNPDVTYSANELVLGWLRHPTYDNLFWTGLLHGIDQTWIQFEQGRNLTKLSVFTDPKYWLKRSHKKQHKKLWKTRHMRQERDCVNGNKERRNKNPKKLQGELD